MSSTPVYLDASPDPSTVNSKDYAQATTLPSPTVTAAQSTANIVGIGDAGDTGRAGLAQEEVPEETIDTSGKRRGRLARYLTSELDKTTTRIPLAINCFLSGCE